MKDTAKEMAKRLVIDSIWKSANLEGLGTTYPKTYAILANAPTNTRAEEVIFIINMKEAWQFLLDNLDCPNNLEILLEYNKKSKYSLPFEKLYTHKTPKKREPSTEDESGQSSTPEGQLDLFSTDQDNTQALPNE